MINNNGRTETAVDFSFSVNGAAAVAFEADGQNDLVVDAGLYTVTEPAVDGYDTTYDNCTNVSIPNGGSATCTITNDDRPAEPGIRTSQRWILHDSADLSGIRHGAANEDTATVTFKLYSDAGCTNLVHEETAAVAGPDNDTASTTSGYATSTPGTPGTYYWTALYSGDTFNATSLSGCGEESTTIQAVQPSAMPLSGPTRFL